MANKNKNRNAESTTPAAQANTGAAIGEVLDPNVSAVPEEEKKGRAKYSENIIMDTETNEPFDLLAIAGEMADVVASAARYAGAFLAKKMKYSGGYYKYITNNGYSNSDFPVALETPAHLNVCIISLAVLGKRAADGDEEARKCIDIMIAFAENAQSSAVDIAKMGHLDALKALGVDISKLEIAAPGKSKPAHAKAK